jgi:hypothetical protein
MVSSLTEDESERNRGPYQPVELLARHITGVITLTDRPGKTGVDRAALIVSGALKTCATR